MDWVKPILLCGNPNSPGLKSVESDRNAIFQGLSRFDSTRRSRVLWSAQIAMKFVCTRPCLEQALDFIFLPVVLRISQLLRFGPSPTRSQRLEGLPQLYGVVAL
jgi:hypothetical protein